MANFGVRPTVDGSKLLLEVHIFDFKEDIYVSSSNQEAYDFINGWPKWIKRIVNIYGPSGSGKTRIASILKNKTSPLEIQSEALNDEIFHKFKTIKYPVNMLFYRHYHIC